MVTLDILFVHIYGRILCSTSPFQPPSRCLFNLFQHEKGQQVKSQLTNPDTSAIATARCGTSRKALTLWWRDVFSGEGWMVWHMIPNSCTGQVVSCLVTSLQRGTWLPPSPSACWWKANVSVVMPKCLFWKQPGAWPAGTGDMILLHGKEDQPPGSSSYRAPPRMWLGQRAPFSCPWPAPHQGCQRHWPGSGRASCWALVAAKAWGTQTCLRLPLNLGVTRKGAGSG